MDEDDKKIKFLEEFMAYLEECRETELKNLRLKYKKKRLILEQKLKEINILKSIINKD